MKWSAFWLSAAIAFAEGTTPKPSPTDYEIHGQAGSLDIGAEYMVHSFSAGEQTFLAPGWLVVEVAIYPIMKTDSVRVDLSRFALRLNGKHTISAQPAARVAASLRASPWAVPRQGPRLEGGGGIGGIGVGMGQPRPIPGSPQDRRLPAPPRAPDAEPPGGITRPNANPEEVLLHTALPEGPHKGPVSGFIYFPYAGKAHSIRSLELVYDSTTLKLK